MIGAAVMLKRWLAGLRIDGHAADRITDHGIGSLLLIMAAMAMIIAIVVAVVVVVLVLDIHDYLLCPGGPLDRLIHLPATGRSSTIFMDSILATAGPQIGVISPTGWLPSRAATEMLPPGSIVFPVSRSAFRP
ncbi:hypothetical protein GCM10007919_03300 [Rhizobium indigoferae]|nr:hypothetical protein GCM10007919_03300 [Rhizobium indigoferae]